MVLNIEIISKEMIEPSSPTPHHLKNHKLSFIDQIVPPCFIPLIIFYKAELGCAIDRAQKLRSLKKSLSTNLTRFYPLAGRIIDDFSVDCKDTGIECVEAEVHAQLSDVIERPDMEELKKFLPIEPYGPGVAGMSREILLSIQVNFFDCGGMAIGLCMSHIIVDAVTMVNFIMAWAATSRGASGIVNPNFDLGSHHFPPRVVPAFLPKISMTKEKVVTRRFVFDKTKIAALKEACSSGHGSQVKDPTSVEAVSVFVWKKFMELAKLKMNKKKLFAANHAVNLRPRMSPPFPDYAFGNFAAISCAFSTSEGDKISDYHDLVGQLRCSIRKIDSDFAKKLENGDGGLDFLNALREQISNEEIETFLFSSYCKFPIYEADYGWGKPVWACTIVSPSKNAVILMSTKSGDGIEAFVNMTEEDMAIIEPDDYFSL